MTTPSWTAERIAKLREMVSRTPRPSWLAIANAIGLSSAGSALEAAKRFCDYKPSPGIGRNARMRS